jgi:hypothetical protein
MPMALAIAIFATMLSLAIAVAHVFLRHIA